MVGNVNQIIVALLGIFAKSSVTSDELYNPGPNPNWASWLQEHLHKGFTLRRGKSQTPEGRPTQCLMADWRRQIKNPASSGGGMEDYRYTVGRGSRRSGGGVPEPGYNAKEDREITLGSLVLVREEEKRRTSVWWLCSSVEMIWNKLQWFSKLVTVVHQRLPWTWCSVSQFCAVLSDIIFVFN